MLDDLTSIGPIAKTENTSFISGKSNYEWEKKRIKKWQKCFRCSQQWQNSQKVFTCIIWIYHFSRTQKKKTKKPWDKILSALESWIKFWNEHEKQFFLMAWCLPRHSTRNALTDVPCSFLRLIRLQAILPFLLTIFSVGHRSRFPLCVRVGCIWFLHSLSLVLDTEDRESQVLLTRPFTLSQLFIGLTLKHCGNSILVSKADALHNVESYIKSNWLSLVSLRKKRSCVCSSATNTVIFKAARLGRGKGSPWKRWPLKSPAMWNRHKIYGCFKLVTGDLYLQ